MPDFGFVPTTPPINHRTTILNKSTSQAYTSGTNTKVTFNLVDVNILGITWNSNDNNFYVTLPGFYQFIVEIWTSFTTKYNRVITINVNGSERVRICHEFTGQLGSNTSSPPMYLQVGDIVEFYANLGGTSQTISTASQIIAVRLT